MGLLVGSGRGGRTTTPSARSGSFPFGASHVQNPCLPVRNYNELQFPGSALQRAMTTWKILCFMKIPFSFRMWGYDLHICTTTNCGVLFRECGIRICRVLLCIKLSGMSHTAYGMRESLATYTVFCYCGNPILTKGSLTPKVLFKGLSTTRSNPESSASGPKSTGRRT